MPKELIITDDIDLEAKDKSLLTFDSFYKSDMKFTHLMSFDSQKRNIKTKDGVYAILSVSDKAINNRLYEKDSLKNNVINGDWIKPFKKPFLRNHDLYNDMPSGRIKRTWFVEHDNFEISKPDGQDELPENVLNYFKDNNCFKEGTGSTIVEISVTEDTYERIANGLDATVSQSSYMGTAKCNICGQDYFGIECSHRAGRSYVIGEGDNATNKICYVECSDFEPVELSIVNNPANNSSILFVNNSSTSTNSNDSQTDKSTIKDDKIDKTLNNDKIEKTENNTNEQPENTTTSEDNKTEDLMFKDLLKITVSKIVTDKFGEEIAESFNKLFDSLETEEQISNLQAFLDSLSASTLEEDEEGTEAEETESETKDENKTAPETKDEKEETNEAEETKNTDEKKESQKSEDLKDIFDTKKTVKDTNLSKKVAAMLNNL